MRGGSIDTGGEVSEEVGLFLVSLKPGKTYELKKQSVIRRRKRRKRRKKKKREEGVSSSIISQRFIQVFHNLFYCC